MCNSGALSAGFQVAGGLLGARGAYGQAASQKSALQHSADIADINATIADEMARRAVGDGIVQESRIKLAGSQAEGASRAQMAARGVDIAGSVSAQARLEGTRFITEVDAATARMNARRAALGQQAVATNARIQAIGDRATAASISPSSAALTGIIGSATQVAGSWINRQKFQTGAAAPKTFDDIVISRQPDPNAVFSWGNVFGGKA